MQFYRAASRCDRSGSIGAFLNAILPKGGGDSGTKRKKTEAYGGKGAGRQSGQAQPEHGRTEAGEESPALSLMA